MKKLISILALATLLVAFFSADSFAQSNPNPPANHGKGFVDKNGDGYNDNAPDDDGDGIPNGLDPDYQGAKMQKGKFIDLDGDGINDNAGKGYIIKIDYRGNTISCVLNARGNWLFNPSFDATAVPRK